MRHVRSCSFVLRLLRNQNSPEVRARRTSAELRARLEQAADRADARRIRSMEGKRVPKMMKWGLIPHWQRMTSFNIRPLTRARKIS